MKITFQNENLDFYNDLKSEIDGYFETNELERKGGNLLFIKASIFITSFFALLALLLFIPLSSIQVFLISILLGVLLSLIGLNVMHEANHRVFSNRKWLNQAMGLLMDLLGGISSKQYRVKHNVVHHTFTNIQKLDGDIENGPLLRLDPSRPRKWFHGFQIIYSSLLYTLLSLTWGPLFDVERLFSKKIQRYKIPSFSKKQIFEMLGLKVIHYGLFIGAPSIYFSFWNVLGVYVLVHMVLGFILSIIFQVAHINEVCIFPKYEKEGDIFPYDQYTHQLLTTANFANNNQALNFLLGGLNFQIEHHLFPNISHIHYPELSKIVKRISMKHNVPYHQYPTFFSGIKSHYLALWKLGRGEMTQSIKSPILA